MSELNEHILLVMRWLHNNDLVSEEELRANSTAAYYAALNAASAAADAAYAAASAASVAASAAAMANNAAYFASNADDDAKHWLSVTKERLNKYFELTEEDRKAYEKRAAHLNVLGVKNE